MVIQQSFLSDIVSFRDVRTNQDRAITRYKNMGQESIMDIENMQCNRKCSERLTRNALTNYRQSWMP